MKQSSSSAPIVSNSASGSSVSTPSLTPSASHGFRSQLGHLLPKHALFQVHLHIEELTNVPLINGQFAVRWKFKNVQSGSGLLSKMKGHRNWSSSRVPTKGKGKEIAPDESAPEIGATAAEDEDDKHDDEDGNSSDDEASYPIPSNNNDPSTSSSMYGNFLTVSPPSTPVPPMLPLPTPMARSQSTLSNGSQSEARGATPWQKLQNYNVKWDHYVNVVVQMDVHRETGALLPNELKLTVRQRVIQGDPDSPQHPRLGAVYLNLAEYADQGSVTRRYLLRHSKTNATLKLTIELEHIGGEKHYIPPPLRKGEILASVSGILANDVLRSQIARDLDTYTRTHSPLGFGPADAEAEYPYPYATREGHADPKHLASSYGLHTTETLIEALFNPLPSASPEPSPFTYFVPPTPLSDESRRATGDSTSADDASSEFTTGSTNTEGDSASGLGEGASASDSALASSSASDTAGAGTGGRGWWKKISNRPGTPIRWNRRPSTPAAASAPMLRRGSPGGTETQEEIG